MIISNAKRGKTLPVGAAAYLIPRKLMMVSLMDGSTIGTPWYLAYVRSTIGGEAKTELEGVKQQIKKMKDHIIRSRNRKLACFYLCW